MTEKSVLALSDISCVGKCSLTIALPVISALGIEVSIIPTALLSTQTGDFKNYYFKDLSEEIKEILIHLKTLNKKFDCIYIGYLANSAQIEFAIDLIENLKKENSIIIVDPVMADNGKLYDHFTKDYPEQILKLCRKADYIFPNLTEALLLTKEEKINPAFFEKLNKICSGFAVTSVVSDNTTKIIAKDKNSDDNFIIENKLLEGNYHGAGDLFASAVIGSLLNDISFEKSVKYANDFCFKSIKDTKYSKRETKYGLLFEKNLFDFIKIIKDEN
jgi:pyridoxine kinase